MKQVSLFICILLVVSCKKDIRLKEDNTTKDITGKYENWVQGGTVLNPITYFEIVKKESNVYYVHAMDVNDKMIFNTEIFVRKGQILEEIDKLDTIIISNDGLLWNKRILKKYK